MKARLKARLKSTVLIFLVMVRFTEGLTWNTKMRSAVCCQCNKQLLIWNFTKGENERVTGLYWFFNEKTLVCFVSNITGFLVADLYEGRVERNGLAGIQLKNVSLNDTGEYTLYVKLVEEKERNVQGINLTVVEPPPNQCKPIIQKEHPNGIISCFTSCERSPLSLEWIINETKDPRGIGPYFVVNSSGTSEQPICCLRDFKCLDYQTKFCTRNNISFTEDMHTVNQSLADTNHMVCTPILIILIVTLIALITVVIACVILLNRRRCSLFFAVHKCCCAITQDMKENQREVPLPEENSPMLPTDQEPHAGVNDVQESETPLFSGTFQELDAEEELDQMKVSVKPKDSNIFAQCKEDLQKVPNVAATTDWPLQDSNQRVQIVNNISIDTDFLQSVVQSNTVLIAELQASRKETRKLKRHLHRKTDLRKKETRHKYLFQMTEMECSDFKNNDTDTIETSESDDTFSDDTDSSKTSESEDAFSEKWKPKRQLHQKKHLRKKENRDKYSFDMMQVKRSNFKKSPRLLPVLSHPVGET